MGEDQVRAFQGLPAPQSCRLVEFGSARVVTVCMDPARHVLVVTGDKPVFNMRVWLSPLIYVQQPDYWGIEVVGWHPDIVLPAQAPYVADLELDGTIGSRGVEVIGANRSERIDIAERPEAPARSLSLSITRSSSGETLATATLVCPPDGEAHPNAALACEQLRAADGRIEGIPEVTDRACTREFDPVVVAASGLWDGEPRYYRQEFSNRCVAVQSTGGAVFEL